MNNVEPMGVKGNSSKRGSAEPMGIKPGNRKQTVKAKKIDSSLKGKPMSVSFGPNGNRA